MTDRRLGRGQRPHGAHADRGAIALLVAAFMVVFMGLAAIVIDLGFARDRVREAQNAADAAALAVATCFSSPGSGCDDDTSATQVAQRYISANGWTPAGSTITIDAASRQVSVTLGRESSPSFFSGVLGFRNPDVAGSARATWSAPAPGTCGLCVFGDAPLTSNPDVLVDQGDLRIGGNLTVGPNGRIVDATRPVFVNGTVNNRGTITPPDPAPGGPVPDPFASLPAPALGQPVAGAPSGACAQGTYADVSGCTSFAPGVYVLTGPSPFTGSQNIAGAGVMFYLTCSTAGGIRSAACRPGQAGGRLDLGGSGSVTLSAAATGTYAGVAIFSDPSNTPAPDTSTLSVHGNEQLTVDGSIYMKAGTLDYSGTPDLVVRDQVVVGTLTGNGNPGRLHVLGASLSGRSTVLTAPPHLVH